MKPKGETTICQKCLNQNFGCFFRFIWDTGDTLPFRPYSLYSGLNFIKKVMRACLYIGECYGKKGKHYNPLHS